MMTEEQETIERDERIEKFLKGRMTPQEESDFKEELSKDSDLKDRAVSMALLIKNIQSVGQKSDDSVVDAVGVKHLVFTPKFWAWTGSIAAMFLICIGIFQYVVYYNNNTIKMGEAFAEVVIPSDLVQYTTSDPMGTVRGEDSSTTVFEDTLKRDVVMENKLKGIISDIDEKNNLQEKIKDLEKLYDEAIDNQQCTYSYLTDDMAWNIAKAYLLKGKRKPAISILEKHLQTYPNTKIRPQIEEQIKKLK